MRFFCLIFFSFAFSITGFSAELDHTVFYKKSYDEAKKAFSDKTAEVIKKYPNAKYGTEPIVAGGETLSVDYLYIPSPQSTNLLVVNSGTHGIEAHVGSAVQLFFLNQFVLKEDLQSTSVLIIHGLNAFGFKHNRRVNENNVDLNRNFMLDTQSFSTKNDGYTEVQDFLNPTSKLQIGIFSRLGFVYDSIALILKYSMESLRRAIVMGQYSVPQGIFYGGAHHQPQVEIFDRIVKKFDAKRLFFVDLHTGYGTRGQLHLMSNDENAPEAAALKSIFAPTEIDWGSKKNFYKVTGDITSYFVAKNQKSDSKTLAMTFEYGTLNSQKTLGSIESLRRMVYENQSYHHGAETSNDSLKISELFLEMFYPEDQDWRQLVMNQSEENFKKILKFFSESK